MDASTFAPAIPWRMLAAGCVIAALLTGCSPKPANRFQGYIEGEYVYVAAPLAGALTHLAVARGDAVAAGQLLFELERQSGWKRKGRARVLQEAAEARNARDPKHVRKRERQAKRRKKKR